MVDSQQVRPEPIRIFLHACLVHLFTYRKISLKWCVVQGIRNSSVPVHLNDAISVDLVVVGCVAVSPKGIAICSFLLKSIVHVMQISQ